MCSQGAGPAHVLVVCATTTTTTATNIGTTTTILATAPNTGCAGRLVHAAVL